MHVIVGSRKIFLSASFQETNNVISSPLPHRYITTNDGVNEDDPILQRALDDVYAAGGGTVEVDDSSVPYMLRAPLVLRSGVSLVGAGAALYKAFYDATSAHAQTYAITATGTLGAGVALAANVARGDATLSAAGDPASVGIVAGGWVLIRDNQYKYALGGVGHGRNEEFARVKSVTGSGPYTIALSERTRGAYVYATSADAIATAAGVGTPGSGMVYAASPVERASVQGLRILVPAGTTFAGGISAAYCQGLRVVDVDVVGIERAAGITVQHSADTRVSRCKIHEAVRTASDASHYGIQFNESCIGFVVEGCETRGIRENPVTNNCRDGVYRSNIDYGAIDDSWNTHGSGCEDITFEGNTSIGSGGYGFIVGFSGDSWADIDITIRNNTVVSAANHAIAVGGDTTAGHRPQRTVIEGNRLLHLLNRGISVAYADSPTIRGNVGDDYRTTARRFIRVEQCGGIVTIEQNACTNLGNNYLIEWVDCAGAVLIRRNAGLNGSTYYLVGSTGTSANVWVEGNTTDANVNSLAGTENLGQNWFAYASGGPSAGAGSASTYTVSDATNPYFKLVKGTTITAFLQLAGTAFTLTSGANAGAQTTVLTADTSGNIGFRGTAPAAKPTVTGSRGANAALASLLTALAAYGLITDSSS